MPIKNKTENVHEEHLNESTIYSVLGLQKEEIISLGESINWILKLLT